MGFRQLLAHVLTMAAPAACLVNLMAPLADRPALLESAKKMEKLALSEEEMQWVHVLAEGWASPLDGFMTKVQFLQSIHYGHLIVDGQFIPMSVPIVKACTADQKVRIDGAKMIALMSPDGSVTA